MKQIPYSTKRLQNVSTCANNRFKQFDACNSDSDGKISNFDNEIFDIMTVKIIVVPAKCAISYLIRVPHVHGIIDVI